MNATATATSAASPSSLANLSTEQKILAASEEAAQVTKIFSPAIGAAIDAGVAVEPVVSGFVHLIIGLFHHHTGVPKPGAPATK